MSHQFIAIEGTIGVGKTTLARRLQPYFNADVLLEVFEENPFLPQFYVDRERYAFQTQIFFLLSRYHQQHRAVPDGLRRGNLISDYTFGKDEIFAWLNLKDEELAMYGRVHAALSEKLVKPDLIVYLIADHEVLMNRIALRDRPYERNMDPAYIRQVAQAYEAWLSNLQEPSVLRVDTNHLDFLARDEDLAYIAGLVRTALERQQKAQPAGEGRPSLPAERTLTGYQQFHRQLDLAEAVERDLFAHYLLLMERMGQTATGLSRIWSRRQELIADGRSPTDAHQTAVSAHQAMLRAELAEILAYLLKLANDTSIDLDEAYREKVQMKLQRRPPE